MGVGSGVQFPFSIACNHKSEIPEVQMVMCEKGGAQMRVKIRINRDVKVVEFVMLLTSIAG